MKYITKLSSINPDQLVSESQREWFGSLEEKDFIDCYVKVNETIDQEVTIEPGVMSAQAAKYYALRHPEYQLR